MGGRMGSNVSRRGRGKGSMGGRVRSNVCGRGRR